MPWDSVDKRRDEDTLPLISQQERIRIAKRIRDEKGR